MRFLRLTFLSIVTIAVLALAVANGHYVTVYLDPLAPKEGGTAIEMRMFAVVLLCVIAGVIIGASAMWFMQGRWRGLAKKRGVEVQKLKRDLALMETELQSVKGTKRSGLAGLFGGSERGLPH
jgi:hypothetical protein